MWSRTTHITTSPQLHNRNLCHLFRLFLHNHQFRHPLLLNLPHLDGRRRARPPLLEAPAGTVLCPRHGRNISIEVLNLALYSRFFALHRRPRCRCSRPGEPSSQQRYSRFECTSSREIHPILLAIFSPNSSCSWTRPNLYKALPIEADPDRGRWTQIRTTLAVVAPPPPREGPRPQRRRT